MLTRMVSVVQNVAIDCSDAYELARFWSEVTGFPCIRRTARATGRSR